MIIGAFIERPYNHMVAERLFLPIRQKQRNAWELHCAAKNFSALLFCRYFLAENVEIIIFKRRCNREGSLPSRRNELLIRKDTEDGIPGCVVASDIGYTVFLLEIGDLIFRIFRNCP